MKASVDQFASLENSMFTALETYSNVHRGSGHKSMITTYLIDEARKIVLEYSGLDKNKYIVIFCSPVRAKLLKEKLKPGNYRILSSADIGLCLGVRALVVKRKSLPDGVPFHSGGGTARLLSTDWIVWASAPEKFEAGTPAIINIIAFAKALLLMGKPGINFNDSAVNEMTVSEILYNDELEKYSGKELLEELRKNIIGQNIPVPTAKGIRTFINLDNSASTPAFLPVWNAFRRTWRQPLNIQQKIIDEVKSICAGMLGAPINVYDFIFTSNATEAINLAAGNFSLTWPEDTEPVLLTTMLEHSSNDLPWRMASGSIIRIPVDDDGFPDLKELETIMSDYNLRHLYGKKRIRMVAMTGASNVLGVYSDLAETGRIVHRYDAHFLVDAAQMVAHCKVDIEGSCIDFLAFSAHKVYAPFGTGVLVVRKGLLKFDDQEMKSIRSSGEENAGGIAALGKALILLQRAGMDTIHKDEQKLTALALEGLSKIEDLNIYGIKDPASPKFPQRAGIIVFNFKKKFSNSVAVALAEQGGIGVRYGCHCAHILVKHLLGISPFLAGFQHIIAKTFSKIRFPGIVRVSFGIGNCEEDVEELLQVLNKILTVSTDKEIQKQIEEFVTTAAKKVYS